MSLTSPAVALLATAAFCLRTFSASETRVLYCPSSSWISLLRRTRSARLIEVGSATRPLTSRSGPLRHTWASSRDRARRRESPRVRPW